MGWIDAHDSENSILEVLKNKTHKLDMLDGCGWKLATIGATFLVGCFEILLTWNIVCSFLLE